MAIAIANFYSAQQTGSGQTVQVTGVSIPTNAFVVAIGTQAITGTTESVSGSTAGAFTYRIRSQNTVQSSLWIYTNTGSAKTGEAITFDAGATFRNPTIGVWVITGADLASISDYAQATSSLNAISVSPTASQANSVTFAGFALNSANTATPDGNSTESADLPDATNGVGAWYAYRTVAGGPGSLPVGGSQSGPSACAAVGIAVAEGSSVTNDSDDETTTPSDALDVGGPYRYVQGTAFQAYAFETRAFQIVGGLGAIAPINDTQTETATVSDSLTVALRLRGTQSEPTTPSFTTFESFPQQSADLNEGAYASDSLRSGNTILKDEAESATATEVWDFRTRTGRTETETVTATESFSVSKAARNTLTEIATASDGSVGIIASVAGDSQVEATTPSDGYQSLQVSGSVIDFTAIARDSIFRAVPGGFDIGQVFYDSAGTWRVDITDLPNGRNVFTATDGYYIVEAEMDVIPTEYGMAELVIVAGAAGVAQYVTDNSQTELASTAEAMTFTQAYATTEAEAATVSDAYVSALENTRQTETTTASDSYGAAQSVNVAQGESATVTDAYQSSTTTGTGGAGRFRVWDGGGWV